MQHFKFSARRALPPQDNSQLHNNLLSMLVLPLQSPMHQHRGVQRCWPAHRCFNCRPTAAVHVVICYHWVRLKQGDTCHIPELKWHSAPIANYLCCCWRCCCCCCYQCTHLCNTHTAAGSKSSGSLMAKLSLRFGRSHQLATLDMMLLLVWHTPLNPK
jgi:hypothetical protein